MNKRLEQNPLVFARPASGPIVPYLRCLFLFLCLLAHRVVLSVVCRDVHDQVAVLLPVCDLFSELCD